MSNSQSKKRLEEALAQLDIEPQQGRKAIERLFAELRQERSMMVGKLEENARQYSVLEQVSQKAGGLFQDSKIENEALRQKLANKERALAQLTPKEYSPPDYDAYPQVEDGYLQVKVKCLECSLHFILCSHFLNLHTTRNIGCPECGQRNGRFLIWHETAAGFIFQAVPGNASLVEAGISP